MEKHTGKEFGHDMKCALTGATVSHPITAGQLFWRPPSSSIPSRRPGVAVGPTLAPGPGPPGLVPPPVGARVFSKS